jgi:DNA-binding transcriptional regulator PaaX
MGKIEEKVKKRTRRKNLQHIILGSVATAGALSVAVVTPNIMTAIKKLGLPINKRQKEYVSTSAAKLARKGLLHFDGKFYILTAEGESVLRRWELAEYGIAKPKRWDGKWRVLIFDIPEKKKVIRNQLTDLLRKAGLLRLQDSVWVYPYDCEDIITLLKTDYGIGRNLLYMVVEELENDKHLRREFGLIK